MSTNNISNEKLFHLMARNHSILLANQVLLLNLSHQMNPGENIAETFENYQKQVEINLRQLYANYGFEYDDYDGPELSGLTDADM